MGAPAGTRAAAAAVGAVVLFFPIRDSRAEEGTRAISFEAEITVDAIRVVSGGRCSGHAFPNLLRAAIGIDGEDAFGWRGGTLFASVMRLGGRSPSFHSGDAQGLSNIDGPNAWWVHEAWVEQEFGRGLGSLRAGLYDLSAEFDAIETASLFLNGSHGTGPEFSQSGINGPSVFPFTALGLRAKVGVGSGYLQAAVLDGVPGDPDGSAGTTVRLRGEDGLLLVAEGGAASWSRHAISKFAAGIWHYTRARPVAAVEEGGPEAGRRASTGAYAFLEGRLHGHREERGPTLDGWLRLGLADPDSNRLGRYVGAGLVWTGLFPRRPGDAFGIGFAHATNGGVYLSSRRARELPVERSESSVELTYRIQVFPWLSIQPDIQWIRNPGTDPRTSHAAAVGARLSVRF